MSTSSQLCPAELGRAPKKGCLAIGANRCDTEDVTKRITYWKDADGRYLGYLNDYPDHWTQGDTVSDLKDHLRDLFQMFSEEEIPGIREEEELEIA